MRRFSVESIRDNRSEIEKARSLLRRFEQPARNLLDRLRPDIDKLEYDSVLGDDTSARIHALVLSQAIREIYGDRKKLETVFVKGGSMLRSEEPFHGPSEHESFWSSLSTKERDALDAMTAEECDAAIENLTNGKDLSTEPRIRNTTHSEEVADYLTRMKSRLGTKTLIVTEEINTGASIDKLLSILGSSGVRADAVSFGIADDGNVEDDTYTTKNGTRILLGTSGIGPIVPEEYLGVLAERRSGRGHAVKRSPRTEEEGVKLRVIREAAKELSHKLAQEYLTKSN